MIRALLCHSNCQTPVLDQTRTTKFSIKLTQPYLWSCPHGLPPLSEPSQYIVRFVIINIYIFVNLQCIIVIHDNFRIYHPGSHLIFIFLTLSFTKS